MSHSIQYCFLTFHYGVQSCLKYYSKFWEWWQFHNGIVMQCGKAIKRKRCADNWADTYLLKRIFCSSSGQEHVCLQQQWTWERPKIKTLWLTANSQRFLGKIVTSIHCVSEHWFLIWGQRHLLLLLTWTPRLLYISTSNSFTLSMASMNSTSSRKPLSYQK